MSKKPIALPEPVDGLKKVPKELEEAMKKQKSKQDDYKILKLSENPIPD